MRLRLYGPLPPPFGGISNHISRLEYYLRAYKIEYKIIDQYKKSKLVLGLSLSIDILLCRPVHIHIFSKYLLLLVFFLTFYRKQSKVMITIHNDRLIGSRFYHFIVRKSSFFLIITVSKRSTKYWKLRNENKVIWLPAFVPPKILNSDTYNGKIICNVWSYYEGVIDDYGLDMLFKLCCEFPLQKFFLFVGDQACKEEMLSIIPVFDNLNILFGKNLVEVFKPHDIFLRLNRVDAFGVSVEEALSCGVYSIASNVCIRPKGSYIFDSFENLLHQFNLALKIAPHKRYEMVSSAYKKKEYHFDLIEIYKKLINQRLNNETSSSEIKRR
jgi:glycosyltransferase involved in cell wall biosynthesis